MSVVARSRYPAVDECVCWGAEEGILNVLQFVVKYFSIEGENLIYTLKSIS